MDIKKVALAEKQILDSEFKSFPFHHFVADGLIDPTVYYEQPIRVLFFLRESYSKDDQEKSKPYDGFLIPFLRDGGPGRHHTHDNVAKWTDTIYKTLDGKQVGTLHSSLAYKKTQLARIGWINVKHESNEKNTAFSWTDALKELPSTAPFMRKQIDLYDPQLIICGGTFGLVNKYILGMGTDAPDHTLPGLKGGYSRVDDNKRIIVDCFHPGAFANKAMESQRLIQKVVEQEFRNK